MGHCPNSRDNLVVHCGFWPLPGWVLEARVVHVSERVRVPEGLAEMAPGPGLSALLAGLDLAGLNGHDLVEVLAAQWRQVSFEQGRFLAMVAEVAHCPPGSVDAPVVRGGMQEFAAQEIQFALGWTGRAADHYLDLALRLTRTLPAVHESMLAGWIDLPRAQVIADETVACQDDADARAVAARVLPAAGEQTTGKLRNRIRRLVLAQNPGAAVVRRDRSLAGRQVRRFLDDQGTASLAGIQLPVVRWRRRLSGSTGSRGR